MRLRDIESTLPPGFRFYPSDEELVCHYLYKKVTNERTAQGTLVEVDLHAREPWELPGDATSLAPLLASVHLFLLLDLYISGSLCCRSCCYVVVLSLLAARFTSLMMR
jgi:hypothetical protein